jgi:hypothetical protein
MKKLFLLTCIALLITSCQNSKREKAEDRLTAARTALEQDNFNEAKLQIDSIKILYPNEFKVRKAAQDFLCVVVIREQQHNLRYLSSVLQSKEQEFETIKGQYTLEKDKRYQEVGNYFWPSQTESHNINRSYLRFQVNEEGIMTMTSVYHGGHALHHRAVKVMAPDGTYAETPVSDDTFTSTNMGIVTEKTNYNVGRDGGVIDFLFLNRNKNIRAFYKGSSNYSITMSPADRKALTNIYSLTKVLTDINKIKKDIEDANVKIKFVMKKQQYDSNHLPDKDNS